MPKDSKGSTGSAYAYIVDEKNKKVLILIDVNKIGDTKELLGTLAEEISYGEDGLAGRQDLDVAKDTTNDEEGLESLGRPINDYIKNKLEDNSSAIQLSTDGIDLTNANVGKKVGDVLLKSEIDAAGGYEAVMVTRIDEEMRKVAKPYLSYIEKIADITSRFGYVGTMRLIAESITGKNQNLTQEKVIKIYKEKPINYIEKVPDKNSPSGYKTNNVRYYDNIRVVTNENDTEFITVVEDKNNQASKNIDKKKYEKIK